MGMIEEDDVRAVMANGNPAISKLPLPAAESLKEVFQRFIPAARKIIAHHAAQPGTLVIVAHGGVLLACLTQLFSNIAPDSPSSTCSTTPTPPPASSSTAPSSAPTGTASRWNRQ